MVQPAALLQQLIMKLPKNVRVFTNSPVVGKKENTSGISLQMGEHRLQARKVIWAANTHLSHLGFASRRQVPVYTYACLTEPIDATQQTLGEELAWGLTPAEQLEATTRKLTDGRLLFRSGFSYKKELTVSEQRELLFQGIKKRYPNIKEKQIKLWVQEQKKRLTTNSVKKRPK